MQKKQGQLKITVTFPDNEVGKELYDWIKVKSQLSNDAAFIRQVLYEKMINESNGIR